jgi:hypothetical protein
VARRAGWIVEPPDRHDEGVSMFDSTTAQRRIGRFAWAMAWFGLVAGQFHAMARHQTADGKGDLGMWTTRVWSDPGRKLFAPLLDWASPDVVYVTWGKIWLPVFLAFTLCAFVVHRRRRPAGFEKWAWRIALVGYVGATASVVAEYWTQWTSVDQDLVDAVFLVTVPFLLITIVGSTLLGIALLRRGFRPLAPAWLLTLTIPALVAISMVTSLGNVALPIAFAFGILGRRIGVAQDHRSEVAAPVAA